MAIATTGVYPAGLDCSVIQPIFSLSTWGSREIIRRTCAPTRRDTSPVRPVRPSGNLFLGPTQLSPGDQPGIVC